MDTISKHKKQKLLKLLEGNRDINFQNLELSNDFLDTTRKV